MASTTKRLQDNSQRVRMKARPPIASTHRMKYTRTDQITDEKFSISCFLFVLLFSDTFRLSLRIRMQLLKLVAVWSSLKLAEARCNIYIVWCYVLYSFSFFPSPIILTLQPRRIKGRTWNRIISKRTILIERWILPWSIKWVCVRVCVCSQVGKTEKHELNTDFQAIHSIQRRTTKMLKYFQFFGTHFPAPHSFLVRLFGNDESIRWPNAGDSKWLFV